MKYTFLTFLYSLLDEESNEVSVTVDPTDKKKLQQDVATLIRNPAAAQRSNVDKLRKDKMQATKERDPLAARIASLRMQLSQLEAQQARANKNKS